MKKNLTYANFKQLVANISRNSLADILKIPIINNFPDVFKIYYYKKPDKRDDHLISYIDNFRFYTSRFESSKICKHCGEDNSRTNVTNECPGFEHLRKRTKRKLKRIIGKKIGTDLERAIIGGYFNTEYPYTLNIPKILDVIKKFVIELILENSKC